MGRGNVCVHGKYEGLYYVDYENFYYNELDDEGNETEEREFDQMAMEYTIENFKQEMLKSGVFTKCDRWHHRDIHVVLESNLFEIAIVDNEWSYAVMLLQKDDAPVGFQKKHYESYLRKIREALFEQFSQLGVYGGAWTSGTIDRPENFFEGRI
jgi:hypothetical protein